MRLTSREKEILSLLRREPLVSQEQMAQHFKITRSSIAVHISNLVKKGVVLGKGYVLNEAVTVVVLGNSLLVIEAEEKGKSASIDLRLGGFAFEASQLLASLGSNVKIVTVVGNDEPGDEIVRQLMEKKVDVSNIYRHSTRRTIRQILCNGDILFKEGLLSEDCEKAIDRRDWVVFNCEWLLVEPTWQEYVHRKALNKDVEKLPYLCSYVDLQAARHIPLCLNGFTLLVLGLPDMVGLSIHQERLKEMINLGMEHCVATDGCSCIAYINQHGLQEFPLLPNQYFQCDGRLPYFLSGLVYGLSRNYPLRQAIRIGVGMASSG